MPASRTRRTFIAWGCAALFAPAAFADTFTLKDGNTVEGQLLEDLGDRLRVRVAYGVIELDKDDIASRVAGLTPWEQYEVERKNYPDTAAGHFDLAVWCGEHRLRDKELLHLNRVIELDPDHARARAALGYEKRDGAWVRPRSSKGPTPQERADAAARRRQDKLVREIVSNWFLRVRAIYKGRLDGRSGVRSSPEFREGREQILAIRDPLAIPALTGVLSGGGTAARRLLVEALGRFTEDEATMNLVVMALLDPSHRVRRAAATELIPRRDDRVIDTLRQALGSDEEEVLRNAAEAIGILKARTAVEDLVAVLSKEQRQKVRVTRPVFLRALTGTFNGGTAVAVARHEVVYYPNAIGVLSPGTLVGTTWSERIETVSVYRTEVQDALIAITGQNFGFDAERWLEWWRHHEDG